jgi:hypothetical protein
MKNILENFLTVLFDYRESGEITYEGEVVFKLIEADEIEEYSELLEKDYVNKIIKLDESIDGETLTDIKIVDEERGRGLSFKINDVEYRYVSDEYSVLELAAKFKSMFEVSGKDAMIWLKENAVNYWHDRPYDTKDKKMALEEEKGEEEDSGDENSFDEIEDTGEFNSKMKDKMDSVVDDLDDDEMFSSGKYIDFELSDGDNVDIEFELKVTEEEVTEDNVEEFLESISFIDTVIDKMSEVVDDYEGLFLQFADLDIEIDGDTLEIQVEFKKVSDVDESNDKEVNEAVASKPTESISPDEIVKTVEMSKILSSYDGEKLFDLLKRKDLLRKDKDDYIKVEVYPSDEAGSLILVFITEVFGYEAEEVVRVETRILGSKLLKLFNVN